MKQNYSNWELIKRFIPYYGKYKKLFISDMIAAILTIVAEITLPLIIRNITNMTASGIGELTLQYILISAGLYLFIKFIEIISNFYMQKYGHIMGANIEKDMRKEIFSHIQYLSDEFFVKTKIGQIISRITNDLFEVTEFAHHCPEEFLVAFIKIIVTFCILFFINIPTTLIVFTMIPFMVIFTNATRKRIRKKQNELRNQVGVINSRIEDSLLGIKVIKSFSNEEVEISKFEKNNYKFLELMSQVYHEMASFNVITRILDALMYISVIVCGGYFLINNQITPGDFILYTMYVTTLLASISRLIQFIEVFEKGLSGIQRYFEIMDIKSDIVEKSDAEILKNPSGEIIFNDVSFKYENNDEDSVLEKINLKIESGSKVALVGPSGGGKTTLTNLIPRFYDVNRGEILIDGKDVRDLTLKSLRENIGIVQQDVYLFSGTILENVQFGRMDATKEEIIKACEMAGAMEFINKLPYGLDTYVGERGVMLSGGQKQRISIARVFLKNPKILILDEATSALDNRSERIIQNSLEELAKGRTTITIAHRLSTIEKSDKIIVLTDSGIQESGNHKELINNKGIYYRLYNRLDEE